MTKIVCEQIREHFGRKWLVWVEMENGDVYLAGKRFSRKGAIRLGRKIQKSWAIPKEQLDYTLQIEYFVDVAKIIKESR